MAVRTVVIDDHRILRDGLKLLLHHEPGFEIVGEASTAAEAMALVAEVKPDLAIVDIALPDESGIVLTQRLCEFQPGIKILVLTGVADPSVAHDVMIAGANGFLRKEEAKEEFVRALRIIASGKVYLSPDAATAIAEVIKDQPRRSLEPQLNDRELFVLKGVAEGKSYKEIAHEMSLSVKSVENYRARLTKKLGCTSRADLVKYAVRKGFVKP
jgi:DNA-binding NarL/FixJ family response regulator